MNRTCAAISDSVKSPKSVQLLRGTLEKYSHPVSPVSIVGVRLKNRFHIGEAEVRKLDNAGHCADFRMPCAYAEQLRQFGLLNQLLNRRTPGRAYINECI
jgi:hypothetical protein